MDDKNEKKTFRVRSFGLNYLFAGYLVWCTFNYDMSSSMRFWFFVWAVFCSV